MAARVGDTKVEWEGQMEMEGNGRDEGGRESKREG